MILYTCNGQKNGAPVHPCARAAKALDEAGHVYEIQVVPGFKLLPWTRRGGARAKIEELTGQSDVPVLVPDQGEPIAGTGRIVAWASSNQV